MMCGLFMVEAGAENPYTVWIRDNLVGHEALHYNGRRNDGSLDYSCPKIIRYYLSAYFGKNIGTTGNGKDVYKNVANAFADLFERIDYYDGFTPLPGDIISFESGTSGNEGYGHVAIVYTASGNTYSIVQQGNGFNPPNKINIKENITVKKHVYGQSYTIVGVARPKKQELEKVDLGNNFEAYIINTEPWKHLTAEEDKNVDMRTGTGDANQIWHFDKNDDGSYTIYNNYYGVLDYSGQGENVYVWEANGGDSQKWFISGESGAYYLKNKTSDKVLDISGASHEDGANAQMFEFNGSSAQKFQVWFLSSPDIGYSSWLYPKPERALYYNSSSSVMTGDDVKWVQSCLNIVGISCDIDGSFGPGTRDAVKSFQSMYGLSVDGSCGEQTKGKFWEVIKPTGYSIQVDNSDIEPGNVATITVTPNDSKTIRNYNFYVVLPSGYTDVFRRHGDNVFKFYPKQGAGTYKIYCEIQNECDHYINENDCVTINVGNRIKDIETAVISPISDQAYTGSEISPAITVKDGDNVLVEGTDYIVSYSNNVDVGTAGITIKGVGAYTGTNTAEFKIVAKSISGSTISEISDQTYTGSAITPTIAVTDGDKALVNGTDYTVEYSNNVNVGTATVTITGKGNYTETKTAIFTIKAAASVIPEVSATPSNGQVTLSWNAVEGAKKYAVAIYENGKYTVLDDSLTGTTYTAKNLTNGKEYKFLVQSYTGKWSSSSTKYLVSATPKNDSVIPEVTATAGDGQVTLTWNAVESAKKYAVAIYENGKYTVLSDTLTGTTYTAKNLTNGTEYKFLVQSYTSKWSSTSTKYLVSATPKSGSVIPEVKATAGDGQVTLTWNAVEGAKKYAVAIYENGKYTVLADTLTGTTYTAKNLTNGKEYKFLVQSYTGKWSSTSTKYLVSATPIGSSTPSGSVIPVVTATAGDGQVTLTWNAVDGAKKYAVAIYENGKYTVLADTLTGTTYTAKNLTNGKEYKFLVQSYTSKWSSTSTKYLVSATPIGSSTPSGSVIPEVNATPGDGQVTLTWNAVEGAKKYAVAIYENGKYTVLADTLTGTTYTAKNLTNGIEYKFLVQSYTTKWSSTSTKYLVSATPKSSSIIPKVTVTSGNGQVTLTWNAIDGAKKYAVAIYENGKYTVLADTLTGTTYTAKNLANGTEYKFLVQSYTGKWSSTSTKYLVSATPITAP